MPTYHSVIPRSGGWFRMRLGMPTASNFHLIVTPGGADGKKAKVSESAGKYAHQLIAEMWLGRVLDKDSYKSEAMERGVNLEDGAIDSYEFQTGVTTEPGGFVTERGGRYGCSPDRLVLPNGLHEMKIPDPANHLRYLIDPATIRAEKRPQAQGQLLVCDDREWVDLTSYHPELPLAVVRVRRFAGGSGGDGV